MTDWNTPGLSDTYTNILTTLKARDVAGASQDFTSDTNLPTGALRYNRSTYQFEEWSGGIWNAKTLTNLAAGAVTVASIASAVLDMMLKPGMIIATGRSTADSGFLLCDGSAVSRTTYANLYSAIGISFGAGDGSTTFNLPDARGKNLLGKAAAGTGSTLGASFGSLDHNHSTPAHYHGLGTGATLAAALGGAGTTGNNSVTPTVSDSGHTHTTNLRDGTPQDTNSSAQASSYIKVAGNAYTPTTSSGNANVSLANTTHTHTTSDHTHSITGSIGLVTGGVDGNAAMTSGANNGPELVINYQIKT